MDVKEYVRQKRETQELEQKQKEQEINFKSDISQLVKTPFGRRFIKYLLSRNHPLSPIGINEPYKDAYNMGVRSVTTAVYAALTPEQRLLIDKENEVY